MDNNIKNDEQKTIIVKGKSEKEILDIYADISTDTLLLHKLLKKYENKQEALEEYKKIKSDKEDFRN